MERNRTPKFRAYHKEYGMRDVTGMFWRKGRLDISLESSINTPIRTTYEKVSLMQSTGLFDNNGVEIFEGDIVLGSGYEYTPIYCNGVYMALNMQQFDREDSNQNYSTQFNIVVRSGCYVVGNIYEDKLQVDEVEDAAWRK